MPYVRKLLQLMVSYYSSKLNIFPFILLLFATHWSNRNQAFSIFEHVLSRVLNVMNIINFSHMPINRYVKTVSKNWKCPAVEEGEGSASRNKQRDEQREITTLFYNPWVFDIFVLLPAIIMQYLYDSVQYALNVWVSLNSLMLFLTLTNNQRILETQGFYCDTSTSLKPTKIDPDH